MLIVGLNFNERKDRSFMNDNTEMNEQKISMYDLADEFIDLAKTKGLTIEQAQELFDWCKHKVLSARLT